MAIASTADQLDEGRGEDVALPLVFIVKRAHSADDAPSLWNQLRLNHVIGTGVAFFAVVALASRLGLVDLDQRRFGLALVAVLAACGLAFLRSARAAANELEFGLEIHRDGIVWIRCQQERIHIPWRNIGSIHRCPAADDEGFALKSPLYVSLRNGGWKELATIPFSRFEQDWRHGRIGAVIRRYAPELLERG